LNLLKPPEKKSGQVEVLVGLGDDAGVCLVNGTALVETVDIITPLVNDPFTFGAISACNSVSDVYAMGGKPLTALAIAGYPSCDYEPAVLREIIKGALKTLEKANVVLMGGHTFEDPELKFGLSVTGIVKRQNILKATGSNEGDLIILTKPIGTGILTTALKGGKIGDSNLSEAVGWMLTLNDIASAAAIEAKATSCSDVTGFGLLGQTVNMVKKSSVDFIINLQNIPVLKDTLRLIDEGMVPEGAYRNLRFFESNIDFAPDITDENKLLLLDPQTSGGLLITLPEDNVGVFEKSGVFFAIIGKAVKGRGRIIVRH
jgi:selenide,water dikinase